MQKIEFIPQTNTINKDRKYFIRGSAFIKIDFVLKRGLNEAKILSTLKHDNVQKYLDSYIKDDTHILETEYFKGKTLENIKEFSKNDYLTIASQLLNIISYLIKNSIIHNDINISNILFNGKKILLIDWETAIHKIDCTDIYGPPTSTNHCGFLNTMKYVKERVR